MVDAEMKVPLLEPAQQQQQQQQQRLISTSRLLFINSFFFLSAATLFVVQGVLLPSQVAAAVPRADRDQALGLCAAIGSAMQLVQPPVGAVSDRQGRRRPWMLFGQGMCAVGCIGLLLARGLWQLTAAFSTFMLGASISWGAYMCIVPEYVPELQHGTASGVVGLMIQGGQMAGSAVGYFAGTGALSLSFVYWGCAALNVLGAVTSWLSLTKEDSHRVPSQPLAVQQEDAKTTPFFSSFRSPAFSAVFMAIFLSSWGLYFVQTFAQYYLSDVFGGGAGSSSDGSTGGAIAGDYYLFRHWLVAISAESASAVFLTTVMLGSALAAFPAGWAAGPLQLGSRVVMGTSFVLGAGALAILSLSSDFTVVLAVGFCSGVAQGLTNGATTVISAEVLPNVADSARDMNMLVTGPVVAQMVVTYGGGAVTQWLGSLWPHSPRLAWGAMWVAMAACTLLALPMLLCARPRPV